MYISPGVNVQMTQTNGNTVSSLGDFGDLSLYLSISLSLSLSLSETWLSLSILHVHKVSLLRKSSAVTNSYDMKMTGLKDIQINIPTEMFMQSDAHTSDLAKYVLSKYLGLEFPGI